MLIFPRMKYEASTVAEYIDQIPDDRKPYLTKLRESVSENIPDGFEEMMNYGMIGYVVPLSLYPAGYHVKPGTPLPFTNIGNQKNFIGLYHMGLYSDPALLDWFQTEYAKRCKYKLDMGKSCVRFKKMDDIPYDLVGELMTKITPEEWVAKYESAISDKKK